MEIIAANVSIQFSQRNCGTLVIIAAPLSPNIPVCPLTGSDDELLTKEGLECVTLNMAAIFSSKTSVTTKSAGRLEFLCPKHRCIMFLRNVDLLELEFLSDCLIPEGGGFTCVQDGGYYLSVDTK